MKLRAMLHWVTIYLTYHPLLPHWSMTPCAIPYTMATISPCCRDFPAEFVDLVYLDPPFNSSRNYNVLFKDESGHEADAQLTAFEDTWHWNDHTEHLYNQLVTQADEPVSRMIEAMRQFIGANQMMAYLVMMAARLVELHRVLKPTGSLYLHCDPTASHYLKVVLDTIFGPQNFRNEIIWKRTNVQVTSKTWSHVSDTILFYITVRSTVHLACELHASLRRVH